MNGAELLSAYSGAELSLTGINIMKMYSASIQKLTAASAIKPPKIGIDLKLLLLPKIG
jgi:hypothetical protein